MVRYGILIFIFSLFLNFPVFATTQKYTMDGHADYWTAFHYFDENQKISSCFVLSNDLVLGFKADLHSVGLLIWDQKARQHAGLTKKVAITLGKEHLVFSMQAMDKNMLMNRLNTRDFETLLRKLSFSNFAVVEYGQQPVSMVNLTGLPLMLSQFRHCMTQAGFKVP